jgi:hypothetical protein
MIDLMNTMAHTLTRERRALLTIALTVLVAGCAATGDVEGPPRKETIQALTQNMELLTINAGQPGKVQRRIAVTGLAAGDRLVGMDYRVAKGVLFALSRNGYLFTLDTGTGLLKPVSAKPIGTPLDGTAFGVDFNPVADRIRVVSNTGQNLRLHPETGAVAAVDPALSYAPGDRQGGMAPELVAAAYTYNKQDEKLTTNYAIDRRAGMLVTQGTVEGVVPAVSPNTGQLRTVGPLGLGSIQDASFDIADISGAAFAAIRVNSQAPTRLYLVNLTHGGAVALGIVGDGAPLIGMAVEP